eukprot:4957821-Pyramimonas_sp.AAC.2
MPCSLALHCMAGHSEALSRALGGAQGAPGRLQGGPKEAPRGPKPSSITMHADKISLRCFTLHYVAPLCFAAHFIASALLGMRSPRHIKCSTWHAGGRCFGPTLANGLSY